jgi:hypothetical protein
VVVGHGRQGPGRDEIRRGKGQAQSQGQGQSQGQAQGGRDGPSGRDGAQGRISDTGVRRHAFQDRFRKRPDTSGRSRAVKNTSEAAEKTSEAVEERLRREKRVRGAKRAFRRREKSVKEVKEDPMR